MASLSAEADADGIPFSAACQSWKVRDFDARINEVAEPSVGRQRLDAIWKLMLRHHLDPTLACLDWPRVHARQVENLGPEPDLEAVDASFRPVFGQLGPEAPHFESDEDSKLAAAPDGRARLRKSEARLTGYDAAGRVLVGAKEDESGSRGPRGRKQRIEIPEGMVLEWWALGAWSVQNVKQMEAAFRAIRTPDAQRRGVLDLRETSGTSVRAGTRLLNSCTEKPRGIGEINDRKGKRKLKLKRHEKSRAPRRLIVLTSERSSAVSQLVAYSAVTDCGAIWFYETADPEAKELPHQARRPLWAERSHALPGGGRLWTRSTKFDLELRVAGPSPTAELRSPEQLTPEQLAPLFDQEDFDDAP